MGFILKLKFVFRLMHFLYLLLAVKLNQPTLKHNLIHQIIYALHFIYFTLVNLRK